MALFLLPVPKYDRVSCSRAPCKAERMRGEMRLPQGTAFQGPVARADGIRKAEGPSANGNLPSRRAVVSFQFIPVAGSLWALWMRCLIWETTCTPGLCHPLSPPGVWSCLQCSQMRALWFPSGAKQDLGSLSRGTKAPCRPANCANLALRPSSHTVLGCCDFTQRKNH